jgi:paraquat-inducible protein B
LANRINPSLIGAFVLGAFLLLIAGLVMLGGGDWFVEKRRFVVYFDNAIKGLTVGAPVTFKGVPVGHVTSLKVHYNQETGTTEIPVLIDIEPGKMVSLDQEEGATAKLVQQMISQGLRAQINPESLITNQQVVQLDFFPGTPVKLAESHLPYPQIPSLPSAFDQLQASLGNTAQNLPDLAAAATVALNQVSAMLSPDNQRKVTQILDNIDKVTGQLAAHGADLGKTLAELQKAGEELNRVLASVDQTIADNHQPIDNAIKQIAETAESTHKLSEQLNQILAENRGAIADFTNGGLYDLTGLIADTRTMVRRATDTIEQLNRDPSRVLFSTGDQGIPAK